MSDLILSTIPSTLTLTAAGQELVLSVAAGSGEANTVANVGGGDAEVFRDKVGVVLNLRTITGTGSITVSENGDVIEISAGAGGEINTGANVGGGDAEVFRDKTGVALNFRTITGLGSVTVTENGNVVEINVPAVGETNLAANVGAGAGVFRDKTGVTLNLRTLVGLSGTTVVVNGDVIEITAGGAGDVVGPASATDNAIARFDGVTGKLLQNSSVTVDDAGIIVATATGAVVHRLGNLQFGGTGASANRIGVATGAELILADGGPVVATSDENDGALAVNFTFDGAQEMTTPGSLLLSVRNKTAGEQFKLDKDGNLTTEGNVVGRGSGTWRINGLSGFGKTLRDQGTNKTFFTFAGNKQQIIRGNGTDIVGRVNLVVEGSIAYSTAGANLFRVVNGLDGVGADVFIVDKDGGIEFDGKLDHDGTTVGLYGTTPAVQSAAYTRDATIVEDRTLLASASATTLNNNNVLAALIGDLQSRGFIAT